MSILHLGFQIADRVSKLSYDEGLLVSLLSAPAQLVFDLAELILCQLLLTKHALKLCPEIISILILLILHRTDLLVEVLLLGLQLQSEVLCLLEFLFQRGNLFA